MSRRHRFINWLSAVFRPSRGLVLSSGTSLLSVTGMVPAGFRYGLEILNDDRTKMEFVVWVLVKHLGQTKYEATRTMLGVHKRGGILLPMASVEEARCVADAVSKNAAKLQFPLSCRAVSISE